VKSCSRNNMTKIIAILFLGVSVSAFAAYLECQWDGTGYELVHYTHVLGDGVYGELSLCKKAAKKAEHRNYVCAPHKKGAALFSTESYAQLGQGWYQQVETCFEAYDEGSYDVICAPESGGARPFDVRLGGFVGNGVFTEIRECFAATKLAWTGAVCSLSKTGTAVLYSRQSGKPMGDEIPTFDTCQELVTKAVDQKICGFDDEGYRPFTLKTGGPHGPVLKTLADCLDQIQGG